LFASERTSVRNSFDLLPYRSIRPAPRTEWFEKGGACGTT
jgi:hypothetical protein